MFEALLGNVDADFEEKSRILIEKLTAKSPDSCQIASKSKGPLKNFFHELKKKW